jgi:spermidine/putrescine transport system permease protein
MAGIRNGPRGVAGRVMDRLSPSQTAVPAFIILWSLLVIVPLLVLVSFSFLQMKYYRIVYVPSLATWQSIIDSGRWLSVVRTLRVAIGMTVVELLLGFPFALWLAKGCQSKHIRAIIVTLLTIPFFLDVASRTIIWRSILDVHGAINNALMSIGAISHPITWLLYSQFSVDCGMLGSYFPTMVFPIYMIISLIDDEYIHASADLGASPRMTLTTVILPLAVPGIVTGIVFTLVPLMAAFVEPAMLGGGFADLLGNSVNSALQELNYPTAAALSTVVILLLAACIFGLTLAMRGRVDMANMFSVMRR